MIEYRFHRRPKVDLNFSIFSSLEFSLSSFSSSDDSVMQSLKSRLFLSSISLIFVLGAAVVVFRSGNHVSRILGKRNEENLIKTQKIFKAQFIIFKTFLTCIQCILDQCYQACTGTDSKIHFLPHTMECCWFENLQLRWQQSS